HQAGLPGFRQPIPAGKPYDWEYMTSLLAAERPFWTPGRNYAYHSLTFGWLVGEIVRRVSGKSLGTFFRDEVAKPLALDFWIGLPEEIEPRVAMLIPNHPHNPAEPMARFFFKMADPNSLQTLAFMNLGGYLLPGAD